MPASPIIDPVSGESLVGTEPQLLQNVDAGWRHRLNLFTGRALSDTALDSEQTYRSGLLATLAQSVTPGTVTGLALTLDSTGPGARISVTPGYGISASGQDVSLLSALKTSLSTVPVIDPVTGKDRTTFQQHVTDPLNKTHAGILILQPVIAQVSGKVTDTGTGTIEVTGTLAASCDQDPEEYAFEDWQIADAVRLAYLPWPSNIPSLPLPAPVPAATWRNRLAYAIFEAESLLDSEDVLPWTMLGVPVALIGFDPGQQWQPNTVFAPNQFITDPNGNIQQVQSPGASGGAPPAWNSRFGQTTADGGITWVNAGPGWKPIFVDCSAVVRAGGLPRRRYIFPTETERSMQWQPGVTHAAGDFLIDANINIQQAAGPGTTGPFEPIWGANLGAATTDGNLTWVNKGSAIWQPNTAFTAGQFIFDSSGYRQVIETAGTSGPKEPAWNSVYLPTTDGTITWINDGSNSPPIITPALAQARINQLSEQLGQAMAARTSFNTLADIFTTLPPSGILPAAALDFVNRRALWLPANWSITAAPVHLEELETVLETGMTAALLEAQPSAPEDRKLLEPVEILIPLSDEVYDPKILVTETVAPVFQHELNTATDARNATLSRLKTIQQELNTLFLVTGADNDSNPSLIDPDDSLTPGEVTGRNITAPYLPDSAETFGTTLPSTWTSTAPFTAGQFVIDPNGAIQTVLTAGTSAAAPVWNTVTGQTTPDGSVTWLNNGPWNWQPNTAYIPGQFILSPGGKIQTVQTAGTSASSQPAWNAVAPQPTIDGITWVFSGSDRWQTDFPYAEGQLILDTFGNIQIVQAAGISGDWPPTFNTLAGQTTADNAVVWRSLGRSLWQPNTQFSAGQAIIDSNGGIQLVQIGGTSGATQPAWNDAAPGSTTLDTAVTWLNTGTLRWQPNTRYITNQIVIDSTGALQMIKTAGTSAATEPAWNNALGAITSDNGIVWQPIAFSSIDLAELQAAAAQAPYTFSYTSTQTVNAAGAPVTRTVTLFNQNDWDDLNNFGLPHFIAHLQAKVNRANDIIDSAFLTVQTDIYRYRQNVLGSTAASKLATSPILANIATGQTAAATADNLQAYINALIPPAGSTTPPPVFTRPLNISSFASNFITAQPNTVSLRAFSVQDRNSPGFISPAAGVGRVNIGAAGTVSRTGSIGTIGIGTVSRTGSGTIGAVNKGGAFGTVGKVGTTGGVSEIGTVINQPVGTVFAGGDTVSTRPIDISSQVGSAIDPTRFQFGSSQSGPATAPSAAASTIPTQIVFPGVNVNATSTDITSQSPLTGAQLNIRSLTIAERLQQSPSQEAMFYSISNRLALLNLLQTLEITLDDLPILVDSVPSPTGTATAPPPPPETHTFSEWFDSSKRILATTQGALSARLQLPLTPTDSAEATLFSVGVRVMEQHTMLLRALEARVKQYADFIGLCSATLNSIQTDIQQATTLIQHLTNDLSHERQNVAFTTALLSDETQRVAGVNAQRLQILQTSVQLIAYTRARTVQIIDTVPSRQLVPANVASPVPACLQQTLSIPPELREIVAMLREAPVNWLPAVQALVINIERPLLLQEIAHSIQARAALQLQLAPHPSSAAGEPRVYARTIANVYAVNQNNFRDMQTQRASFQPAAMQSLSWSLQVATIQSVAAINDLIAAESIHTEIANATARLVQQISSVAACLYARAALALPIDRLAWAEYLSGPGNSVQLSTLATLPKWNEQSYIDRQQMQLVVDWLFQQVDTTNSMATAYMSDIIRTAILLASDVPPDNFIPGSILIRTQPAVGGNITLNLPSDRVSSGMYVHLYSGSELAAHAVVNDLDSNTVSATITSVFKPGAFLETSDVAHFTAQSPTAVALRPFMGHI